MIVLIAATGFVVALVLGPALRRRESRDPVASTPVPGMVLSPGA